jgi:hypothetical protein
VSYRLGLTALAILMLGHPVFTGSWLMQAGAADRAAPAERVARGLWSYESLGREGGTFTNLQGLFVFLDGWFVQQSLNEGEPFDRQVAQAHAGPYGAEGDRLHLTAHVGFIVNPARQPAVESRQNSEHVVTPTPTPAGMELRFGTGTIQKFRRAGPGQGTIYPLSRGALALVDGHFILVAEAGDTAVAGSGRFERQRDTLRLDAARWVTVRGGKASYARGPIQAKLDKQKLELPDGLAFELASR